MQTDRVLKKSSYLRLMIFKKLDSCLSKKVESRLCQASAHTMEPKVAPRLTQYGLVIVMNFFVTNAAWIDGRSIRVLWIEHHWLIFGVNFF